MQTCKQCGKEAKDNAAFCEKCGSPFPKEETPIEGANTSQTVPSEPQPVGSTPTEVPTEENSSIGFVPNLNPIPEEGAKQNKNKLPIYIGAGALALVALFFLFKLVMGLFGSSHNSSLLYVKNNKIYFTDFSKKEPIKVMSRDALSTNRSTPVLLSDGKTLIYLDNKDDGGASLYLKNISKEDSDKVKIDSNVLDFIINEGENLITYSKSKNDSTYLYQKSLKKPEGDAITVAKKVSDYWVSNNGKTVVYSTKKDSDEEGYTFFANTKTSDEESEPFKIEKEILSIRFAAEDLSKVYYMKDDKLMKKSIGDEEAEVISKDVKRLLEVYNTGEAYYLKEKEGEESVLDLINDDLKESDSKIKILQEPDYVSMPNKPYYYPPSEPYYSSFFDEYYYEKYPYNNGYSSDRDEIYSYYNKDLEEYEKQYQKEMDQYNEEYEQYQQYEKDLEEYYNSFDKVREKEANDRARENLKAIKVPNYSLCYYDGKKETILAQDSFIQIMDQNIFKPFLVYEQIDKQSFADISFSSIKENYFVSAADVLKNEEDFKKVFMVSKDGISELTLEKPSDFTLDTDGKNLYFSADPEDDSTFTLYKAEVSGSKVSKPEKVEDEVNRFRILQNGDVAFMKEVEGETGTLYINGKKVAEDIFQYFYDDTKQNDRILIYSERNDYSMKLETYSDGKKVTISDDVYDFLVLPDGKIAVLKDWDRGDGEGELHLFKKEGDLKKIDDGVNRILTYDIRTK